jgi:hypothetical protein
VAYSDVKAAIVVHAAAAAAALTTPILDARAGFPIPKGRCVRVYYAGETAPEHMDGKRRVLTGELVSHITRIALFLPVSVTDEALAAVLDAELFNFGHDLRTRILGDSQLGGASKDLTLHYCEPDLVTYNNVRYLLGLWDVVSDFVEYTLAQ